jgi:hypothetical protein
MLGLERISVCQVSSTGFQLLSFEDAFASVVLVVVVLRGWEYT